MQKETYINWYKWPEKRENADSTYKW